jgi:hypothetical protein
MKQEAAYIDTAVPITHNIRAPITEIKNKYSDLAFEIKQQWQLSTIAVTPQVSSATRVIPTCLTKISLSSVYVTPTLPGLESGYTKHFFHPVKIPQLYSPVMKKKLLTQNHGILPYF